MTLKHFAGYSLIPNCDWFRSLHFSTVELRHKLNNYKAYYSKPTEYFNFWFISNHCFAVCSRQTVNFQFDVYQVSFHVQFWISVFQYCISADKVTQCASARRKTVRRKYPVCLTCVLHAFYKLRLVNITEYTCIRPAGVLLDYSHIVRSVTRHTPITGKRCRTPVSCMARMALAQKWQIICGSWYNMSRWWNWSGKLDEKLHLDKVYMILLICTGCFWRHGYSKVWYCVTVEYC